MQGDQNKSQPVHAPQGQPQGQQVATSQAAPRAYAYPQMMAPGVMQASAYQQAAAQHPRPATHYPQPAVAPQTFRPAPPQQQPPSSSGYLPHPAPMGMQAAIELLAQGQRAYANAQRPVQPQFAPQARPLTGLPGPGRPPGPKQNLGQPTRKYNKKRKTPEPALPLPTRTITVVPAKMPDSQLYTELQAVSESITKAMAAQKMEVRWAMNPQEHVKKRLRVYVYSTHHNQPNSKGFDPREPPFWTVTVWGKLMESGTGAHLMGPKAPSAGIHKPRPLSFYLKSLKFSIVNAGDSKLDIKPEGGELPEVGNDVKKEASDTKMQEGEHEGKGFSGKAEASHDNAEKGPQRTSEILETLSNQRVWEKASHTGESRDRFQIRFEGGREVDVEIELETDSQPVMWETSEDLAALTGLKLAPRTAILHSLATYIKSQNLQDDSGAVKADAKLQKLFGTDSFSMSELPKRLEGCLTSQKPYKLPFTVRPSLGAQSAVSCFDLDLYVAVKPEDKSSAPSLDLLQTDPEVEQLQTKINGLVGAAIEKARRRTLLLGFAANPKAFIEGLIALQARDVRGTPRSNQATAMRRTEVFQARWVENAVLRYLHRKMAAGG